MRVGLTVVVSVFVVGVVVDVDVLFVFGGVFVRGVAVAGVVYVCWFGCACCC